MSAGARDASALPAAAGTAPHPAATRTPGASTAVEVLFRAGRNVDGWSERHARGEVPGRWPYGLDLLGGPDATVTRRSLPEPGRVARLRGRWWPTRPRPMAGRDVGVAWDENVARLMLLLAPHAQMYAGAIWLTDALAVDPGSARVRQTLRTLRRMQGVFVNSRAQVEPLERALGPTTPVSYFTFGVDADFFPARPPAERPLVVSIGGDRDRDPATLFAALARVRQARPDVDVVVQSGADLAPPPGVTKVPRLSHLELRDLYARASVVAVATRPNLHMSGLTVSLESMATARPVVLTATPGVEDYVVDGETGFLVPPRTPDVLAERVLALLADPDAAATIGRRARTVLDERFTSAHMVEGMARAIGLR